MQIAWLTPPHPLVASRMPRRRFSGLAYFRAVQAARCLRCLVVAARSCPEKRTVERGGKWERGRRKARSESKNAKRKRGAGSSEMKLCLRRPAFVHCAKSVLSAVFHLRADGEYRLCGAFLASKACPRPSRVQRLTSRIQRLFPHGSSSKQSICVFGAIYG